MAYELHTLERQKVRYNSDNGDNPLITQLQIDGAKKTPSSATITIYANGSTTALVSAAAMTVSGSLLKYSVDTTTVASWPVANSYKADVVITYSGETYPRVVMFDVVKFVPNIQLARDQILDRDDLVSGWNDSDDLEGLILACRDELNLLLEAKAFADERVTADMILDQRAYSVVLRLKFLAEYWAVKKDEEKAERYDAKFEKFWGAFIGSIRYDKDQDGHEDTTDSPIVFTRLVL